MKITHRHCHLLAVAEMFICIKSPGWAVGDGGVSWWQTQKLISWYFRQAIETEVGDCQRLHTNYLQDRGWGTTSSALNMLRGQTSTRATSRCEEGEQSRPSPQMQSLWGGDSENPSYFILSIAPLNSHHSPKYLHILMVVPFIIMIMSKVSDAHCTAMPSSYTPPPDPDPQTTLE